VEAVDDYQAAITLAAKPLLEEGFIEAAYIEAMLDALEAYGSYIVLTDYFALPHARPSKAVKQTGLSLLLVREAVDVKTKPVHVFIVLAAKDDQAHIQVLGGLAEFLMEPQNIQDIIAASTRGGVYTLLKERWTLT
jgi:mannitol/fructose-specific phosphotransferase system IIA component (Ntr-type)